MALTPLNELAVFVSVARHKSFTRAAKELGVSTSAVSQSVRLLEERVQQALFFRTTRNVSLTDAGQRLLERAAPGLESALNALEHLSADTTQLTGTLRLTVPSIALASIIEPVLPRFLRDNPHVHAEVRLSDRFVDIVEEGLDAGLRLIEAVEKDMVQVRLTPAFRFMVLASPSYLKRHGTPMHPEDLAKHDCITYRAPTTSLPYHWELERGRKELRIQVKGRLATDHSEVMYRMAVAGVGLTYLAELQVAPALRAGTLVPVLEDWAPSVPGIFLYYPHRARASAPLRAFIALARKLLPTN
ncbi:LysR family transcriptional regulator [Myxococcus sp. CA051A]|uniref:Transcriptional regulator LysR family n=1 Tax=Myxococcus fulvus TaxID=33 RepID=A0A3S5GYK0_MYXFU|nr:MULTISPECIES: LysR family transcriptional regulator [unclassified Myxococcus]AYM54473.1 transcriptional regulator LysR family [Myxococcus fulvus]NTX11545.1 LysR family transcriptional regulator [Myxococcus sp. CA056]NTX34357.1 LysR family transcriptional regulator [Myxococcus sp. CA033]NTX50361.1 LysR family transcriptional regulator [Myxococcus sp. CA039A]NTX60815.1 LysR family transcriptional regulator [Myxococcus sp. CA051A]